MAGEKTAQMTVQQQRDAEDLAYYRRRAEESERQNSGSSGGLWDFLKSLVPDMGFGGLLMLGIVMFAAYTFGKTEGGQNFIKSMVDHFEPDTQAMIYGFLNQIGIGMDMKETLTAMPHDKFKELAKERGIAEDMLQVIAPDQAAKNSFIALVAKANKGNVLPDYFTNDATLFTLMTERPTMMQALAKAAMKPGAEGTDTGKKVLASLKTIVGDERLNTLLNAQNRENTIALLVAALPSSVPLKPDAVAALIRQGIGADGKATEDLRKALLAALDQDVGALMKTTVANKPVSELLALVDSSKITDPLQKACVDAAKANPDLVKKITDALGTEKSAAFVDALRCEDPAARMLRLALNPENIAALPSILELAAKVPGLSSKFPVTPAALNQFIQTTGMKNGQPTDALKTLLASASGLETLSATTLMEPLKAYLFSPEVANNRASVQAIQSLAAGVAAGDDEQLKAQLALIKTQLTPERLAAMGKIQANGADPLALAQAFLPQAGKKFSVTQALEVLLEPKNRTLVEKAGLANIVAMAGKDMPLLNEKNLTAFMNFSKEIDQNPDNRGEAHKTRSTNVLAAFTYMADGVPMKKAFEHVSAADLSGFFKSPRNHEALRHLLEGLDQSALDRRQKFLVNTLLGNMGSLRGRGFTSLLADPQGAAFLLNRAQDDGQSLLAPLLQYDWAQAAALKAQGGVVAQNSDIFVNINAALKGLAVTDGTPDSAPAGFVRAGRGGYQATH